MYKDFLTLQQVVELKGYVIILVETRDKKVKLYGSPAEKDNLEVADEILDVNETRLEHATRAEVIKHIHECIQSCMIKLRVKRRSESRLAIDLGSSIQDAFVIAVEQQARERLQRLSALKRITPVDMSQLSIQLNQNLHGNKPPADHSQSHQDLSFLSSSNPIYVTSLNNSDNQIYKQTSVINTVPSTTTTTVTNSVLPNGHGPARGVYEPPGVSATPGAIASSVAGATAISDCDVNEIPTIITPGCQQLFPNTDVITTTLTTSESEAENQQDHRLTTVGKEVLLGEQVRTTAIVENTANWENNRPRRRSGSSIVVLGGEGTLSEKPRLPVDDFPDIHNQQDLDMVMMLSLSGADAGPHREMAVDVPDSFVARNKTPPRYPPPKPPQMNGTVAPSTNAVVLNSVISPPATNNHIGSNNISSSITQGQQSQQIQKPVPPPRDHLRIEKDGRLVNRAPAPQVPARTNNNNHLPGVNQSGGQVQQEPTPDQLDSIRKFQEQLRKRREEEERIAQQNEFLRASLRGSRKLQALQDGAPNLGVINDAYCEDELNDSSKHITGYGDLVATLQRLQSQLNKHGLGALAGRVSTAQSLLLGPAVARALSTRSVVLERRRHRQAVNNNAQTLVKDCVEGLAQSNSPAAIELCDLLSSYEMEGLISAHDRIATSVDRSETVAPLPSPLMTDDHIKIIQIEKTNEPLGATIRNEGDAVIVGRVVRGGAAEKTGLLHVGDEILEVNGVEMRGKTVNDVCALLGAMSGTLTFLVVPAGSPPPGGGGMRDPAVLHVRAHFDYDPEEDTLIPCRELGISFQKGDVLHVISREDPNWWQTFREGEEDQTLAGLVPSQSYQLQRESLKQSITAGAGAAAQERNRKSGTLLCAKKATKKKKRGKPSSEAGYPLYAASTTDDNEPEEILTYEEVSLYYPRANHKRPVVLIGPPNIGRHELRQRLMGDAERFAAAIPHTSRARRDGEVSGQDYHFITRAQFEADILARRFVEHGEYEKAYYGTSLDAIRSVVSSGKICVLNLHPQSLKLLRSSDLKPYTVLVAPPSLEKLRQKRLRSGEPYKEEELKDIIATARDMESRWGHLFDMIIINNDTERAYHQLLSEINSLEREPQWVPASWLRC